MAMAAAGLSIVERDVPGVGAAKHREPLLLEKGRTRRQRAQGWQLRQRVQQGAPSEVGARERRRWAIVLDVRGGAGATRVASGMAALVAPRERAGEQGTRASSEPELGELRDPPLPEGDGV